MANDITSGEHSKKLIRFAVGLARKKLGKKASIENIRDDLQNSQNDTIRFVNKYITKASDEIKQKFQEDTFRELSEFALWLTYNHPDLRIILFNFLEKFLRFEVDWTFEDAKLSRIDLFIINQVVKYTSNQSKTWKINDVLEENMKHVAHPTFKFILDTIKSQFNNYENDEFKTSLLRLIILGVWSIYRDTGYIDPACWVIYKISNNEIREMTKNDFLQPKLWYVNLWHDGMELSKEKQKKGEISVYEHSKLERRCVPTKQFADLNKK